MANANHRNHVITTSVDGSGNMTVALKTLAGADPSSSDPLLFKIGDSWRAVTAALSVTIPAGGNTFNTGASEFATIAQNYFPYVRYNAIDGVCVGVSRISHARVYSDFGANGDDETVTDEDGAVWNDITTAAAGDDCAVIGRFTTTHAAAAGYEWSSPGSEISEPIYETDALSYVPTWTNLNTANATVVATYKIIRRICYVAIGVTFTGAAITGTGVYFSLPYSRLQSTNPTLGSVILTDFGSQAYMAEARWVSSTARIFVRNTSGTYETLTNPSATIPHTWASTDLIDTEIQYDI